MNDLNRIKDIFEKEGFDVFSANGGEVILIYLPNTFEYQGLLMTISFEEGSSIYTLTVERLATKLFLLLTVRFLINYLTQSILIAYILTQNT